MGLTPSTVANSDDTGGSDPMWAAAVWLTPWAWRPWVMVCGSRAASPAIIREKKAPMDSAVPEFWKVERTPEATPRWLAGTLLMMAAVLGAENIPTPTPLPATSRAKAQ